MSIFGFSSKDNDQKTQFGTWYIKRFKPVYLTHVSAMNIINGSTDLTKVNDLKKELKLKYLEATKFSSGPYTVGTLPILGTKTTASTASDVNEAIEMALKDFVTSPGGTKTVTTSLPTEGKSPQEIINQGTRLDLGAPDDRNKLPGASVSGASNIGATSLKNTVSAFDLVRFKTYGLKELEVSKIVSLTMLEMHMSKVIKYQGTKAVFEGNPNELLEKVTTYFGVPDLFSDQAVTWGKWFRDRFLAVYLNYATLHMQAVNKAPKADSVPVLDANQQYDIALAVSSTAGVWRVTDSPWDRYDINTNPETIKGNLEFLKDAAKQKTVRDQEGKTAQENNNTVLPAKKPDSAFVAKTPEYNPPTSGSMPTDAQRSKSFSDDLTRNTKYIMPARAPGALGPESSTVSQGSLLEYIGDKESGGNYNVLVGGKIEPSLTNLTVGEVIEYQKGMKARGHESSAVGKYQIIRKTLESLVQAGYAKMDDVFSPQTQDKLAMGLLKIRGLDSFLSGKLSKEEFADNLSKEWASLPYRTGSSYYNGVGGNKSSGTREEFVKLVNPMNIGTPDIATATYAPQQGATGGIMKATYSETPKSIYNPVARPAAVQKQAVQASKQASTSSLNDALGYNPRTTGTVTENNNASKNTLTADIMKNTESILSESLSVHKETLEVMRMIYDKINSVKSPETVSPKSEARKYEAPMVPVPMRKSA
jgi:muramidase (phage lysozyme)